MSKHSIVRHRIQWIGSALLVVASIGLMTYHVNTVTVRRIQIDGALHAPHDVIADLAGVALGDTLFSLDPDLVANRIDLHPWVETSAVTRWPHGVLSITVSERTPVALSVSASGQPGFYIDRDGALMPVDTLSRYDVPLVRGVSQRRSAAIRDTVMLELLAVLSLLPPSVDGLLSDLVVQPNGDVEAVTVPARDGQTIHVRLGHGEFGRKMETLRAFWAQAVAGYPNKRFEWIDLRFQGQVVTKEISVIS